MDDYSTIEMEGEQRKNDETTSNGSAGPGLLIVSHGALVRRSQEFYKVLQK